jgi:hypothetical protein
MDSRLRFLFFLCVLVPVLGGRGLAAVTVQARIDPPEVNVGDEVTVTYTVQGGSVGEIQLPPVDGLTAQGSSMSSQFVMNGFTVTQSISDSFNLVPTRPGDFTIPSLSIHADNGQVIHTPPLKLHVLAGAAPSPSTSPPQIGPTPPPDNNNSPVTNPPTAANPNLPQSGDPNTWTRMISVPTEADGRPARVFNIITPKTTDAYVGEAIPLTIQCYIRADSLAQQNSLPTLVGSDFLMNNLSLRPMQDGVAIDNEEYQRVTWITAISAPKPGDFPLEATRDTYWTQSNSSPNDPFGGLFGQPGQLMHKDIGSNKLVIHVHPLPDQDRPANFTGAIGHFQVSGNSEPATVGVGEPVTLHFTISGEGNFDYVRAPALAPDPAWKSYVPSSKVTYAEESHTQATKTFEQAVIPQKNGTLPLPAASFSYFDPDAKHYVTVPVPFPAVVVTGESAIAAASPPPSADDQSGPATATTVPPSTAPAFAPNQLGFGVLTPDLAPAYRHPGFWVVQGGLATVLLLGLGFSLVRPRPDPAHAERALRHASLRQEEDAMSRAVREGDAVRFFAAARHGVQLKLAERWHVAPESLTLNEISRHDEALREAVAPLFQQADDVIYSGQTPNGIDLAEWDRRVRTLLQPVAV